MGINYRDDQSKRQGYQTSSAQAVSKAIAEAEQPELQAKKAAEAMLQASLQSCNSNGNHNASVEIYSQFNESIPN